MLTLFQALMKEPLVAEERRKTVGEIARGPHIARIDPRRRRPAACEPRENDGCQSTRDFRGRWRGAGGMAEEFQGTPRGDREGGAVSPRWRNHRGAVNARRAEPRRDAHDRQM